MKRILKVFNRTIHEKSNLLFMYETVFHRVELFPCWSWWKWWAQQLHNKTDIISESQPLNETISNWINKGPTFSYAECGAIGWCGTFHMYIAEIRPFYIFIVTRISTKSINKEHLLIQLKDTLLLYSSKSRK
jgi:hypothetical protein